MSSVIKFVLISILNLILNLVFVQPVQSNGTQFEAYWNVPSSMCHRYGIKFENITQDFGIIHNAGDNFRGEKYTILYDPGNFPALLQDSATGEIVRRNGGVPPAGNLTKHLEQLKIHISEQITDPKTFNGICCIDFESWRPIFRQNFGVLTIYKDVMRQIEKDRHPDWNSSQIENEATKNWEEAGREFVEETLKLTKSLLPNSKIGYYVFPYCFNNNGESKCSEETINENDQLKYIWKNSDIIFPSVYLRKSVDPDKRGTLVRARVVEAKRVASLENNAKILSYIRTVYSDDLKLLSEEDLRISMKEMKLAGSNGVVLWGASADLNTKDKCYNFQDYVQNVLGPIVKEYTLP